MYKNIRETCRKVIAVGRNYKDHAKELNNPVPQMPVIFMKPSSSIIQEGDPIIIPKDSSELHHEVELGIVIGDKTSCVNAEKATSHIAGYVLALDMTDRNLQNKLKADGLPWVLAKGFDTSCPISNFIEKSKIKDSMNLTLNLKVNGETRQNGSTSDMIWSPAELISFVSQRIKLERGDILLTGTPAGVGPVIRGDQIEASIEGIVTVLFDVV